MVVKSTFIATRIEEPGDKFYTLTTYCKDCSVKITRRQPDPLSAWHKKHNAAPFVRCHICAELLWRRIRMGREQGTYNR